MYKSVDLWNEPREKIVLKLNCSYVPQGEPEMSEFEVTFCAE